MNLTQEQLNKLNMQLLEIPGKFGLPIIQMLNEFFKENTESESKTELEVNNN